MRHIMIAGSIPLSFMEMVCAPDNTGVGERKEALKLEAVRKSRIQPVPATIEPIHKPKKDKSHLKRGSSYFNRK